MNTYIWLIGGILATLTISILFLQIFSNMTVEKHRQDSIKSLDEIANKANTFCMMNVNQSSEISLTFSSLVSKIFAVFNGNITEKNNRTLGNQICMNISNEIYCSKKLNCQIEVDKFASKKTIPTLIDKILGKIAYRDYRLNFIKTKCGVSILLKGSKPICGCDLNDIEVPIYCEYNGKQPILLLKNNVILLADTYNWINVGNETETLLNNIADYFGGKRILLVFEENITNPEEADRKNILDKLRLRGYNIDVRRHASKITNFEDYDQIWLITPGFCDEATRNCQKYKRWHRDEINEIIKFVKNGGSLLLITDSGMRKAVYERVGLEVINKILRGVDFPFDQIQSCVCACREEEIQKSSIENHELTKNLSGFGVNAAGVFRCRYQYYSPETFT